MRDKEFLWVEKYRPKTIEDCVLPERIKSIFRKQVETGEVQNMILVGPPGVGKTSVAVALCDEIGLAHSKINASLNRGIDTLRVHISNYASTVPLQGRYKVQILDEADGMSKDAQDAFKGVIEQYSKNCKFILTANDNTFIEPIVSRCVVVDFNVHPSERQELAAAYMKAINKIAEAEGFAYDKKPMAQVIMDHFPDFRKIINTVQLSVSRSKNNTFYMEDYMSALTVDMDDVFVYMKEKDFDGIRKWVVDNMPPNPKKFFRDTYLGLKSKVDEGSIPIAVLITGKYQHMATTAVDQEINIVAYLTELMLECEFK
jgi:DNA polymerase III delta prime subunit